MSDMDILAELMMKYRVVVRAIPKKIRCIVDKRHIDQFPDGKIVYMEEYKREMLVYYEFPQHGGQFLVTQCRGTNASVDFRKPHFYFNSLFDIIEFLEAKVFYTTDE